MNGDEGEHCHLPLAAQDSIPVHSESNPWFVEVVERAQAGDRSAFDALYQGFYTPMRIYLAHMVGNDEEGEDLAQETFLKAWQGLPNIHNGYRFDTWLYRIATNTAIDHLRRRKFRLPRWKSTGEDGQDGWDRLPESMWIAGPEERVAEMEHIQQALAQVSLKYRSCMLLQIVVNLSQREIAASLHISEKSVSVYVSRGAEQFRLAYQRLLQANSKTFPTEGDQTYDRLDAYALFGLGTEAFSQAPG